MKIEINPDINKITIHNLRNNIDFKYIPDVITVMRSFGIKIVKEDYKTLVLDCYNFKTESKDFLIRKLINYFDIKYTDDEKKLKDFVLQFHYNTYKESSFYETEISYHIKPYLDLIEDAYFVFNGKYYMEYQNFVNISKDLRFNLFEKLSNLDNIMLFIETKDEYKITTISHYAHESYDNSRTLTILKRNNYQKIESIYEIK